MYSRYGLIGLLRLLFDLVHTRFVFIGARLVRHPAYIRGKRHIRVGKNFTTGVGLRLDAFPTGTTPKICIEIGNDVQLNDYVHIGAIESVRIGDNVLIASKVFISDHNHGCYRGDAEQDSPDTPPALRRLDSRPVIIDDNAWIGEFVAILPGVRIGRGAIIGAMSVVTQDIPAGCMAAGAPARVIKKYDQTTRRWQRVERSSS